MDKRSSSVPEISVVSGAISSITGATSEAATTELSSTAGARCLTCGCVAGQQPTSRKSSRKKSDFIFY
ncbi:MAG: hypothetical protein KAT20_07500, partial [Desulfuromonadales bacterium]|nr:hypothetical protein [Desulfuromonadales bacterium]